MRERFVSINFIIEALYRDLALDQEPNWLDWVEWAAEALDYIGARLQYVIRSTDNCDQPYLEVVCNKAKLPKDFHKIITPVVFNGKVLLPQHNDKIYANPNTNEVTATFQNDPVDSSVAPQINMTSEPITGSDYYTIVDGCIVTSIESGNLIINYLAIPMDDQGFPMIPDEYFYRDAIKAYITYRIDHIAYRKGSITDRVYNESKQRWIYTSQAARNEANMPTTDEMELIKRQWIRLYPDWNAFDNGMRTLNNSHLRKIQ